MLEVAEVVLILTMLDVTLLEQVALAAAVMEVA
jgi:hypothetical protein